MNNLIIAAIILLLVYSIGYLLGYILWKKKNPVLAKIEVDFNELDAEHTDKKYECGELKETVMELREEIHSIKTRNALLESYVDIFVDRQKIRQAMDIEKAIRDDIPWWGI